MRISFLLTKCTPDNGHGRYVIELARRLAENHSIKVYAGEFWRPLQSIATCRLLPVLQRPAFTRLASLWVGSLVAVDRDSADSGHGPLLQRSGSGVKRFQSRLLSEVQFRVGLCRRETLLH